VSGCSARGSRVTALASRVLNAQTAEALHLEIPDELLALAGYVASLSRSGGNITVAWFVATRVAFFPREISFPID
jgi:hypothetical protein